MRIERKENEMTELLPCPFCGGEAEITYVCGEYAVMCKSCKGSSDFNTNTSKSISRWNTRVYPKEVQKAIERDKPRNPVRPKGYSNIECPTCGAHLKQFYEPEEANVPFCYHCGQRLDWSK